ncbi:MAG: hypothetical protein QOK40_2511 [Miltoncostaeaceae bacterium]|nr:hypothetical protein [Miltoncostaeaceae bacterium]
MSPPTPPSPLDRQEPRIQPVPTRADTPERLIEAFEWFRQQIIALRAAERRRRPRDDRSVLP